VEQGRRRRTTTKKKRATTMARRRTRRPRMMATGTRRCVGSACPWVRASSSTRARRQV
jgi:hypothetical protein